MLTVVLGTWRAGAVYQPIHAGGGGAAFNVSARRAAAIAARIDGAGNTGAKLVVTDSTHRAVLDLMQFCPPVLVVTGDAVVNPGDGDFLTEPRRQSASFAPVCRDGEDPFILLLGGADITPRMPRPRSLVPMLAGIQIGLDPREADIGWDVTDPAWSLSLYLPVLRPLLAGNAATVHHGDAFAAAVTAPPTREAPPRRATAFRRPEDALLVA